MHCVSVGGMAMAVLCSYSTSDLKWVSRRVGGLVLKWAGGGGPRWSTPRLNDLGPPPPGRYTFGAGVTGYLWCAFGDPRRYSAVWG